MIRGIRAGYTFTLPTTHLVRLGSTLSISDQPNYQPDLVHPNITRRHPDKEAALAKFRVEEAEGSPIESQQDLTLFRTVQPPVRHHQLMATFVQLGLYTLVLFFPSFSVIFLIILFSILLILHAFSAGLTLLPPTLMEFVFIRYSD